MSMNSSVVDVGFVGEQSIALPPISNFDTTSHGWHSRWYHVVYLVLALQTAAVFWNFWWKAPV